MTRNNDKKSRQVESPMTISTEDNIVNLPDLSAYQEDEKRHILNVLIRDEHLRNKHLSRFMNLRKEVAELEQQSQTKSPSACARCQTPFGFIFNTGDICPKCGEKVCKQCRLMYNVNDNGWLCILCCKQMQLMSYSGEWIYSIQSNLRKGSLTPSQLEDSLPPSASALHLNTISSSDSDEEIIVASPTKRNRFDIKPSAPPKPKLKESESTEKLHKMIAPTDIDEKKLSFIKGRMKVRPLHTPQTQPLPKRTKQLSFTADRINSSSDDNNSVFNRPINHQNNKPHRQVSIPVPKHIEIPATFDEENIDPNEPNADCMSVTSSEWGDDPKIEKEKGKKRGHLRSTDRDSQLNLAVPSSHKSSSRKNLSASMQSLRDAVHRIPRPHLSSSRTSLSSKKKRQSVVSNASTIQDENSVSIKVPEKQNKAGMYPTWSSG